MTDGLQPGPPLTPGLGGPSLEEEEKAMRSGRGGFWVAVAVVVIALIGGAAFLLTSTDESGPYRQLGQNITTTKRENFDGLWVCVFGRPESPANNSELTALIHTRAEMGGPRFGPLLRDRCQPKLDALEVGLDALIPPDDMRAKVGELVAAARTLRGAFSDYSAYLSTVEGTYDRDAAASQVSAIGRGWYEFKLTYSSINNGIRTHLDE